MIIKRAENGFIVKHEGYETVFENADTDNQAFVYMLCYILQSLGPHQNDFSDSVIAISLTEGDEYDHGGGASA